VELTDPETDGSWEVQDELHSPHCVADGFGVVRGGAAGGGFGVPDV
jgi:hypothetical protein